LSISGDVRAALRARYYLRGAEFGGARVRLWGKPSVSNQGRLVIGDRVRLYSTVATLEIGIGPDALLEIGSNVLINYGCSFGVLRHVKVGNDVNIGTHCMLIDNAFHRLEPDRRNEAPPSEPIVLGDNVWLAARVIVLPGVSIGDNSVVGAGSVVTQSLPENVLAAGCPAKVLRTIAGPDASQDRGPLAAR